MAITETRSLPPQFVEDLGKDYAAQLTGLTSQKLDTKKFQPMVAGQDQAQKDAYSLATTQGQGIGAYAPYLQSAGQYQNQSDMNRALLQSQMLQGGFQNAQTAANQAFTQTQQLGADQQRMAQLVPGLYGSDVSTLGSAGANQQLYEQQVLDQQREANRMAAYEPYERLGYMGAGMGNVMGGAMGQYQSQVTPNQSPLQQALGIASLGLGAYKALNN